MWTKPLAPCRSRAKYIELADFGAKQRRASRDASARQQHDRKESRELTSRANPSSKAALSQLTVQRSQPSALRSAQPQTQRSQLQTQRSTRTSSSTTTTTTTTSTTATTSTSSTTTTSTSTSTTSINRLHNGDGPWPLYHHGDGPCTMDRGCARVETGPQLAYGGVSSGGKGATGPDGHSHHQVSFSIGVVGTYWLSISLRASSEPVCGSPFLLSVTPGKAHALRTQIPLLELRGSRLAPGGQITMSEGTPHHGPSGTLQACAPAASSSTWSAGDAGAAQALAVAKSETDTDTDHCTQSAPLTSLKPSQAKPSPRLSEPLSSASLVERAGKSTSPAAAASPPSHPQSELDGRLTRGFTCRLTLATRDRMGNTCSAGGAQVAAGFMLDDDDDATLRASSTSSATCIDHKDGTYAIEWRAVAAGDYKVFVHVDGLHVLGSPALMSLVESLPLGPD